MVLDKVWWNTSRCDIRVKVEDRFSDPNGRTREREQIASPQVVHLALSYLRYSLSDFLHFSSSTTIISSFGTRPGLLQAALTCRIRENRGQERAHP